MKNVLILTLAVCSTPAIAAKLKGTPAHVDITNIRRPSGSGVGPCASDIERMKGVAAESLAKAEIDSDKHKLEVTAASFHTADAWTTDANDASVLNLGGKAKQAGNGREFFVRAQAVCSPSTGKFELMSTHYSN
jgi:hypothetical protein